ncbi:MAG: CHAT domain-containing protein [bacterium]
MVRKGASTTLLRGMFAVILLFFYFPPVLLPQASDQLQSQYKSVLKLLGKEEYEQAIFGFQKIIQENPDFSKAYRNLVEAYLFLNELDKAQAYFENLLSKNSRNAYANYALARIHFRRKEYDRAIEKLKRTIALDPNFADAYSYRGGLPEVYKAKNELDTAIQFFSELIQAEPENPCAYYGLARSYIRKYEWQKALDLLSKAIEIDPDFTLAYHSLIFVYSRTSRYDKVLECGEKLFNLAETIDDFEMKSYAAMMIGTSFFRKGDYLNALQYLNESFKIANDIGAKRREGACLNTIAVIHAMSGNYSKALQYFKQALPLLRKTGAKLTEVRTLTNIGNVYKDQGSYEEALKYYQDALKRAKKNNYKNEESLALSNMSEIYQKRAEYHKAITYQNQALKTVKEIKHKAREGYILRYLGSLNQDLGHYAEAINYYRQALEIGKAIQNTQIIWESQAGLGVSFEKQGNSQQAIHHYAKAIALYDSVRQSLDIESLGNNFLEDKYQAYPSIVQLLALNGKNKEALTYAEKYKAKAILDILSQGQSLFSELLSDTLQAQLKQINSQLEDAHAELSRELLKTKKDERKILSLDQKITDFELKKAAVIEDLKKQHNEYYHLTYSNTLQLKQIQKNILGTGQALVEYIVGPEKLSIFLITPDTLIYTQVAVSRERLQSILADLSPLFKWEKSTNEKTRQQILNPQLADFSIPPAYALYEVLVKPVEPQLQSIKELIIVPDDILFYLPFEMLVCDSSAVETPYDFDNAGFLLEKYVISYASSASLLDPNLRRVRKSSKGVMAVGNPDFKEQDEGTQLTDYLASNLLYSGSVVRGGKLVSLPNSESEVKAIGKMFEGGENRIFIGNRATEENFKAEAEDYRILHLATHFLANDSQPLYSKIVLAQKNQTKEDGFLQTYEIFNMNLNADLVVLSACNTGLGKLRKGEGLIGVSRAFLYAGVPSLVVSLWSVDDESTSTVMKSFYGYLNAGLNKKQALQLAKIDYLKSSQSYKKDPFYWAPFILIGDWTPINRPTRPSLSLWILIIVIVLIVATAARVIKNRMRFSHQK